MTIYDELKKRALELGAARDLLTETVSVTAVTLSTEEAIGNPEGDDFPLQKGKERLMQATFKNGVGQAFTDQFGDFSGTLQEIFTMPLTNNFRKAVFVATLNAVTNHLDLSQGTIHCRDKEPSICAAALADHVREKYGEVKVTQVGFQPKMVEHMAKNFDYRILDMDPDNIGQEKYGVVVEGPDRTQDAVDWADMLLVTGTTLANGTVTDFVGDKPVLFYGTTIAGAAALMGWERFCDQSK